MSSTIYFFFLTKTAFALVSAVIGSEQTALFPAQAPVHALKRQCGAACAVSVTG
jgi:hypothetical protein